MIQGASKIGTRADSLNAIINVHARTVFLFDHFSTLVQEIRWIFLSGPLCWNYFAERAAFRAAIIARRLATRS